MNRQEHLLTILAEECAEVTQEVAKILRFGYTEGKKITLQKEVNDLLAALTMLRNEGFALSEDTPMLQAKMAKVERYLLESKELGTLTDDG